MTTEEMRKRKEELNLTYRQLADMCDVPLGTVQKVISGITKNPRHDTMIALEEALSIDEYLGHDSHPLPKGKKQGEYTIADYLALPDDDRYELIDGYLYYMEAPNYIHQLIANQINIKVANYISSHKGKCVPVMSPADVQLDGADDDLTMVEPDFFIISDRNKMNKKRVFGAPDFVLEVLSPSTRKKDINIKTAKYEAAGVKEYWIVDPDKQKVIVHIFGEEPDVYVYGFDAKVPIYIYDNDCVIDFNEIYDYISFLL
ncbi:MAG: Uma2 family endonuclease [Lachnospiraceae bacterium]|nr:Uma2 family endonuclease [Lachnospiraceae bacterium]